MGKSEEEQHLPRGATSSDRPQNAETECRRCCCCSQIQKLVGFRCILVFLFSLALFLSALFWLPPFLRFADQKNLHDDSKYKGHDIVASFIVKKPVAVLEDNKLQLAREIFDEIEAPSTTTVNILSLDPLPRPNKTKVVFAVDPNGGEYSETSSPAISLIRSLFTSLVIHQSVLQLTSSLFGDPFFFEVLKFKGGITVIPQQNAFPLQKVQTKFNFSLNFPIYEIQSHFSELTNQLKTGLHLTSYENLHVVLSNVEGSTVDAPTIIQSSVLLAVGIPPSRQRLEQLAQTIMGPHNLGLNNTEFGRVKQVRLSTILQHSLNGSDTGSARSPTHAPSPQAPQQYAPTQQQAQPASADEVRTLWIVDLQYWMDEIYSTNVSHTPTKLDLLNLFAISRLINLKVVDFLSLLAVLVLREYFNHLMAQKPTKVEKKIAYDAKLCQLLDEFSQILIVNADNVGAKQL